MPVGPEESHQFRLLTQLTDLLLPVRRSAEVAEGTRKRRVVPALGNPGAVANHAHGAQGLDQRQFAAIEVAELFVQICIGYEIDGHRVDSLPYDATTLDRCQPIYEEHPGWRTSIRSIVDFEELPAEAARFVARIEELVGAPADIIGVGAEREQTISRASLWDRPSH